MPGYMAAWPSRWRRAVFWRLPMCRSPLRPLVVFAARLRHAGGYECESQECDGTPSIWAGLAASMDRYRQELISRISGA